MNEFRICHDTLTLVTNDFARNALEIAELYKKRRLATMIISLQCSRPD